MKTLQESQAEYVEKIKAIQKVKDRIEQRKAQIRRLEKKENRLWEQSFWADVLIRPILDLVEEKYPELDWKDGRDRLVPMGLSSRVSVFPYYKGKYINLSFTPTDLDSGLISYDTGEIEDEYEKGSIGYLNGFNNVRETITDIQQIYDYVERRMKEIDLKE
jgi:hypothetical protein